MKLNIVICEDVKTTMNKITSVVSEYFENSEFNIACYQFQNNFQKVIEFAKNLDDARNVYLLDIDLNDAVNGLQLAQKIREYDYLGYIVFITSHTELGMTALSYKLKILDFIDKANDNYKKRLYDCFETIIRESTVIKNEEKHLLIKSGSDFFPVLLGDIIYVETDSVGRKIIIHTHHRTIESYTPLKEIERSLDDRFFRCHRAAIVNLDKIQKICNDRVNKHLELAGGNNCPLSSRKIKELTEIVSKRI